MDSYRCGAAKMGRLLRHTCAPRRTSPRNPDTLLGSPSARGIRREFGLRHLAGIAADQIFAIGFVAGGLGRGQLVLARAKGRDPGPHFTRPFPAVRVSRVNSVAPAAAAAPLSTGEAGSIAHQSKRGQPERLAKLRHVPDASFREIAGGKCALVHVADDPCGAAV